MTVKPPRRQSKRGALRIYGLLEARQSIRRDVKEVQGSPERRRAVESRLESIGGIPAAINVLHPFLSSSQGSEFNHRPRCGELLPRIPEPRSSWPRAHPLGGLAPESPRTISGLEYVETVRRPGPIVEGTRKDEATVLIAHCLGGIPKHFRDWEVTESALGAEIEDIEHKSSRNRLARVGINNLPNSWTDRFSGIRLRRLRGAT